MSLEKILKKIPLGLTALFLSCGSNDGKSGEKCSSDFDCKGDRICVYGQCTDSNYNGSGNNGNQSEDASSYQPRQNYDSNEYAVADTSSITCNQNCGSSCDPNCSPLLYEDFNSPSALWNGDDLEISGGTGSFFVQDSIDVSGDCSQITTSIYSYSMSGFKKFRLRVRAKGENKVSPYFGLSGGDSWGNDTLFCMYNMRDNENSNIGFVCDAQSGIPLEYPAPRDDNWHDFEVEWFDDGSIIANFDGVTAGYINSTFPPKGNYAVDLSCGCMTSAGKCFFDYVILTREN